MTRATAVFVVTLGFILQALMPSAARGGEKKESPGIEDLLKRMEELADAQQKEIAQLRDKVVALQEKLVENNNTCLALLKEVAGLKRQIAGIAQAMGQPGEGTEDGEQGGEGGFSVQKAMKVYKDLYGALLTDVK